MGRFETFYHWDLGASRRRTDGQFPSLYFGAGAGGLGEWYLAGLCWHLYCAHSCSIFKMAVLAFWAIFLKEEKYIIVKFSLDLVVGVVLAENTNMLCLTGTPGWARWHSGRDKKSRNDSELMETLCGFPLSSFLSEWSSWKNCTQGRTGRQVQTSPFIAEWLWSGTVGTSPSMRGRGGELL